MATEPRTRLRISLRSIAVTVAGFGLTVLLLHMASTATRVIGWIVAAATVAGLITPIVDAIHRRRVPRGIAVALVALFVVGGMGLVGFGVGSSVVRQYRAIEDAVPDAAARLERSERFGNVAREARLEARARRVVRDLPSQLQGGTTAEIVRSTATRGVAFMITAILTLFFVVHGPRMATGAVNQIGDDRLRERVARIGRRAWDRGMRYSLGTIAKATVNGLIAYAVARAAAVPGAAPLALWVAMWDIVPVVGMVVGAAPVVVLAGVASPNRAVLVALVFVAYEVFESLVLVHRLERRTLRVGPLLTVAAGAVGLEAYGLGGAGIAVVGAALLAALADELVQERTTQEAAEQAAAELAAKADVPLL